MRGVAADIASVVPAALALLCGARFHFDFQCFADFHARLRGDEYEFQIVAQAIEFSGDICGRDDRDLCLQARTDGASNAHVFNRFSDDGAHFTQLQPSRHQRGFIGNGRQRLHPGFEKHTRLGARFSGIQDRPNFLCGERENRRDQAYDGVQDVMQCALC